MKISALSRPTSSRRPFRPAVRRFKGRVKGCVHTWWFPKIGGPHYRPQNATILIITTPKNVPLILGNPHMGRERERWFCPSQGVFLPQQASLDARRGCNLSHLGTLAASPQQTTEVKLERGATRAKKWTPERSHIQKPRPQNQKHTWFRVQASYSLGRVQRLVRRAPP